MHCTRMCCSKTTRWGMQSDKLADSVSVIFKWMLCTDVGYLCLNWHQKFMQLVFKILHTFSPLTEHRVWRHFINWWEYDILTEALLGDRNIFRMKYLSCHFCGLELYFLKHLISGHMCHRAVINIEKRWNDSDINPECGGKPVTVHFPTKLTWCHERFN